jgi:hypothetical protein
MWMWMEYSPFFIGINARPLDGNDTTCGDRRRASGVENAVGRARAGGIG